MDNPLDQANGHTSANGYTDVSAAMDYHAAEIQQFTQQAINEKGRWALINMEQNVKGLIVGMLSKLDEKYQVRP